MTTQLKNISTINAFAFAGNATVTLRSTKTGTRFTFKIQRAKKKSEDQDESDLPLFVKLLSGPNNADDFVFMGTVFPNAPSTLRGSGKSRISSCASSFKAFAWWLKHIGDERVEVWHEDHCGRCGRTLTVPESIATGLGPICAAKSGVDIVKLAKLEAPAANFNPIEPGTFGEKSERIPEEQLPDLYDMDPTDQSLFE